MRCPHVHVGRWALPAFQVCGVAGLAAGIALASGLAPQRDLSVATVAVMAPGAVGGFFALAMATKVLTGEESSKFWPLQREYDAAATELGGRRVELIRRLLEKGGTYSDAEAKKLAREVFALEHERTKLKETWFKKFLAVIPAAKATRYFQIENQLNAIIDLRVAAELPLIH